jgi:hypothetical protein
MNYGTLEASFVALPPRPGRIIVRVPSVHADGPDARP